MSEDMARLEDSLRGSWAELIELAGLFSRGESEAADAAVESSFLELASTAATMSIGGPNIWLEWIPHTDVDACLYGCWGESKRVILSEFSELPAAETQDIINTLYHNIGPGFYRRIGSIPDDDYVIHN